MLEKIKQYQKIAIGYAGQLRDLRVAGLMVFLVIVLMIGWNGVKAIETNYKLQKQISALKQENALKKLENDNMRLENDYYNTPQYLDVAARQDFGLAAPGETVISVPQSVAMSYTVDLPKTSATPQQPHAKLPSYVKNLQAWMDFLLHRRPAN